MFLTAELNSITVSTVVTSYLGSLSESNVIGLSNISGPEAISGGTATSVSLINEEECLVLVSNLAHLIDEVGAHSVTRSPVDWLHQDNSNVG